MLDRFTEGDRAFIKELVREVVSSAMKEHQQTCPMLERAELKALRFLFAMLFGSAVTSAIVGALITWFLQRK